jgi:hypothetical protein
MRLALCLALVLGGSLLAGSASAKHVQAQNQIWIDKVGACPSSHGLCIVKPYLKVNLGALDGKLVEVGFRAQEQGKSVQGPYSYPWMNKISTQKYGNDYFAIEVPVKSDYHTATTTGAFYARTDKGTWYWLKTGSGQDFTFDPNAFGNVVRKLGSRYPTWDPSTAAPTQGAGGFGQYYNPRQLK